MYQYLASSWCLFPTKLNIEKHTAWHLSQYLIMTVNRLKEIIITMNSYLPPPQWL